MQKTRSTYYRLSTTVLVFVGDVDEIGAGATDLVVIGDWAHLWLLAGLRIGEDLIDLRGLLALRNRRVASNGWSQGWIAGPRPRTSLTPRTCRSPQAPELPPLLPSPWCTGRKRAFSPGS